MGIDSREGVDARHPGRLDLAAAPDREEVHLDRAVHDDHVAGLLGQRLPERGERLQGRNERGDLRHQIGGLAL